MKLKRFISGALALLTSISCFSFATACDFGNGSGGNSSGNETSEQGATEYVAVDYTRYKTYYFDAAKGNDANDGLSENSPKATLSEAENLASTASESNPVRLLFKKGSKFVGNSVFEDYESTEALPLVLDSYGDGESYPVFTGWGSDTEINAVMRFKDDNVRIYNLEVTGPTAYQGIFVQPDEGGVFENVVIEGCYVHDINFNWTYQTLPRNTSPDDINVETVCPQVRQPQGDNYGRYVYRAYSAICLDNDVVKSPAWFENVWIKNNKVVNVGKIGINVYNRWDNQPGFGYGYNRYMGDDLSLNDPENRLGRYPHRNVYAQYNYLECCGADGLVLSGVEDGVLEGNVSYYANYLGRSGYWNAAIWIFGSRNILFQYNEAAYTYMRNGGQDAQGFDLDNACSNITFRYNYSHHNEGGGILLCNNITTVTKYDANGKIEKKITEAGKWENNHIYNNIFAYNGNPDRETRSAFITIARQTNYAYIYNNTVLLRNDIFGQSIIDTEDKSAGAACHDLYFYNNIFCSETQNDAKFTITMMYDYKFENNLFYNVTADGLTEALNVNPITTVNPQITVTETTNLNGYTKVNLFRPNNTEVFALGRSLSSLDLKASDEDILGNKIADRKYLGAIGA